MKKLLLAGLVGLGTFASADWNWISSVFKKEIPTIEYTIDASGRNPRVYEFDTQGNPMMHCVVFLRPDTRTSPTMACVKISKQEHTANKKLEK